MTRLYTDVMLDIETLDDRPSAVVLSIALTAFASRSDIIGPSLHTYLELDEQARAGRTISPRTVLWWLDQNTEVRSAQTEAGSERLPANLVAIQIQRFFGENVEPGATLWAKSPSFDCVILKDYYRTMVPDFDLPWSFRDEEDVRGVVKRAGTSHVRADTAHDALSDTMAQIDSVQIAVHAIGRAFGRG